MKRRPTLEIGVLLLAGAAFGGELEPPGPPAATMKSLNEIPPTWSLLLDSTDGEQDGCNSSRFRCVMNDEAVLDFQTGLVWERSPLGGTRVWSAAVDLCLVVSPGGTRGWRLPRIKELMCLVDPGQSSPPLPPDRRQLRRQEPVSWNLVRTRRHGKRGHLDDGLHCRRLEER